MSRFAVLEPGSRLLRSAPDDLTVAVDQIAAAALQGEAQEQVRADVLAFCERHPDALHRSCPTGHLTGSAVVVDPAAGTTLLVHHLKLGRWLQPGGHADGDGNLGSVALREAAEETGLAGLQLVTPAIDIDVHTIPGRTGEPEHVHLDLRSLVLVGDSLHLAPNHETLGARWLGADAPEIAPSHELSRLVTRALEVATSLGPR